MVAAAGMSSATFSSFSSFFCSGLDLLRLICVCLFLSGTLGTIRESKGWMAVVSDYLYWRLLYIHYTLVCFPVVTSSHAGGPPLCGHPPLPALHLHLPEDCPAAEADTRLWERGVRGVYPVNRLHPVPVLLLWRSVPTHWRWSSQSRLEVPKTCCRLLNKGVRKGSIYCVLQMFPGAPCLAFSPA